MKIIVGSDHAGFELKSAIVEYLKAKNIDVVDIGPDTDKNSVDYPDYANKVVEKILAEQCLGILICGTGIGMCITANRHKGVRAANVTNLYSARMAKSHNNANILCLGSRITAQGLAFEMIDTWLTTEFEGGRHQARLAKIC